MKFSKRSAALVATGIAGVMALAACGGGSSSSNNANGGGGAAKGGQVTYGESTDFPENLYPNIAAGNATSVANILIRVLPSAFNINPDLTVGYDQNLLAEEPKLDSGNGTQVVTYKLNPKAVWSDGTAINGKDFEFTWRANRSGDPADGGCPAVLSTTGYEDIKSVDSTDNDQTVTVTFTKPYADWQALFGNLLPAHLMDKGGDANALCDEITTGWTMDQGIVGDISGGPWQLKKENISVDQQTVILTPNPKWWGQGPNLSQLIIRNIGNDPTTTVQALKNQEVGVIYPQPQLDLVDQVKGLAPNVTSTINFGLSFEHLDFNTTDKFLSDINVRRAFALALNRDEIVKQTVGQFSSDAQVLDNRIWLNNQPQYKDTAPAEYKQQNIAQAKQLLEQSGYKLGPDGIYVGPQGRLSIQIDTTKNNPLRQTTIEVMIPQLKQAGIEAKFNANPDIFASKEKPTSLEAGGFQAALFAWVSSPFVSANQSIYAAPQGDNIQQNYSRIGNQQIDQLFQQLVAEPDPAKQADLGNQIDTLLWDQMATIPLYQKPTFMAFQSTIQGPKDNPSQAGPLWNSETWSVKQ